MNPVGDLVGSNIPIVGSLWTSFKINRLKKRLDMVVPKLKEIKKNRTETERKLLQVRNISSYH